MKILIAIIFVVCSTVYSQINIEEKSEYYLRLDHSLSKPDVFDITEDDWNIFLNNYTEGSKVEEIPSYLCGGEGVLIVKKIGKKRMGVFNSSCSSNFTTKTKFHYESINGVVEINIKDKFVTKLNEILSRPPTKPNPKAFQFSMVIHSVSRKPKKGYEQLRGIFEIKNIIDKSEIDKNVKVQEVIALFNYVFDIKSLAIFYVKNSYYIKAEKIGDYNVKSTNYYIIDGDIIEEIFPP